MKHFTLLKTITIAFFLLAGVGYVWGQATLPLSRTTWDASAPTGWTDNGTGSYTTSFACTGNNSGKLDSSGDYYQVHFDSQPGEMIFKLKSASMSGESKLIVEESSDGNSWTSIGDYGTCGSCITIVDCDDISVTLNSSSRFVKWTYTKASGNCVFDDVSIASGVSTPLINVAPSTLTGFTYLVDNGPSAEQSFTVAGTNLGADITLAPPTNYEISTGTGGAFSPTNPITLTPDDGTVAETTIYVRLKAGLSAGTYNNEDITATSTDADNKTVTCSGTVTSPPPPDAPVATAATAVGTDGFTANWNIVSGATGYFIDVYTKNTAVATDLFISEYIEGTSNNKAIEIYNGTGSSIDLSGFNLKIYVNGSTTPGSAINLSGTLANGEVYVVANSSSNATILAQADLTSGSLTFNGNDAVGLFDGTTLLDVVGPIGDDSNWGIDVTLVRKSSVTGPTVSYSISDWDSYATDTFTYLGSHTMGGGNVFVLEDESVGNVTSYDVTGLDPGTTYYYVVRAANAYGTSDDSNEIEVETSAGNTAPVITSPTATAITATSATLGGTITSDGGSAITERGTVWKASAGVTIADNKLAEGGTTTGTFAHSRISLPSGTQIFYRAYATNDIGTTLSDEESFYTLAVEPTNHPSGFTAEETSASAITVTWTDAVPAAAGYLIKGSTTSYAAIVDPVDGTPESNALLVQNIAAGAQTHQFTGLAASTQYFFKIFPYNGSGATINYKTDDTVPQDDATTEVAPVPIAPSPGVVFISEVSDATGFNNEYIEFYNNSGDIIDLSNSKLIMQTDGTVWNISNLTGDTEIPANGLFVITRGATKTAFETEWGALPTNCNYSEGTSGMFFGTSTTRRWVLKDGGNPGIDDGTLIDDTETTVAGETNRTFQYPTGTWTTEGFSGNSTPGYLDSDEDPAAYIWTDEGTESNWGDANNWNPNQVPGPNTNVTIPSSKANIVIQATETADCHNLTVDGTLTIQSNATNTGSLIINGTVSGSGTMTMQRHIPAWTNNDPGQSDGWHLLGTPVATFNIDGSPFDPGSLDDFYGWSETTWEWLNHKVGNPTQMEPGIGYLVAYQTTDTKDFTGTFNNADVTHTNLSVTPTKGNGWHLLGNPFQSALHWTNAGGTWNPTNIETGAKILQNRTYVDITADGANQYIPANQGFFVKATNTTNSITIPAAERVHNSTAFYKSVPANVLELAASDGINNTVRTWIQIMDDATAGFDEQYDMHFLGGMYQAPHLYSKISETERLSTNRIAPIEESTTVQLAFKSFHDVQYTIKANLVASFESNLDLILEDTQEGVQINLRETPEYTFAATANELTERFKLHLLKATGIHEIGSADFNIYAHGGVIYLNGNKATNAQIELFNTTGQRVFARSIYMDGLTQINPQLTTGWYVVKVSAHEGVATQKVFIK
jgi:hypothetical protein